MEMSRSMDSQSFDEGSCEESMESGLVLKKGPWTPAEDAILVEYVNKHGEGNWNAVQKNSGLFRCGKSCRLRWANHLRPNLKKGAFTAEEERLIIELHAKMGNKWARMAANLPGRTDNEIKNYWNTRIKRRQRAGLPLYPPEVCLKALSESHQSPSNNGFSAGNTQHQDLLQDDSYEIPLIPDVIFENLNANPGVLSYPTAFSDIYVGSSLGQGLSSSHTRSFMPPPISHLPKRPRESENLFSGLNGSFTSGLPPIYQFQNYTGDKIRRPYGLAFPYNPDPDPKAKNFPMFCGKLNGNALLDSNFSASKPIPGAVKLELPSFQYSDNELGNWETSSPPPTSFESVDAFIQSPPPTEQVQSDCLTSDNSGLLEAVLHGSHSLNSSKNQLPETGSNLSFATTTGGIINSLNQCDTGLEGLNDPISPLSRSAASVFGECTPVSRSSISEPPDTSAFPGSNVKVEPVEQVLSSDTTSKEISTKMNISARPDALLGACWFGQRNNITKEHPMTDAIASFLGEDFSSDYKDASAGTSTTQGFELGSIPWNNMPGFHQIFELP